MVNSAGVFFRPQNDPAQWVPSPPGWSTPLGEGEGVVGGGGGGAANPLNKPLPGVCLYAQGMRLFPVLCGPSSPGPRHRWAARSSHRSALRRAPFPAPGTCSAAWRWPRRGRGHAPPPTCLLWRRGEAGPLRAATQGGPATVAWASPGRPRKCAAPVEWRFQHHLGGPHTGVGQLADSPRAGGWNGEGIAWGLESTISLHIRPPTKIVA